MAIVIEFMAWLDQRIVVRMRVPQTNQKRALKFYGNRILIYTVFNVAG